MELWGWGCPWAATHASPQEQPLCPWMGLICIQTLRIKTNLISLWSWVGMPWTERRAGSAEQSSRWGGAVLASALAQAAGPVAHPFLLLLYLRWAGSKCCSHCTEDLGRKYLECSQTVNLGTIFFFFSIFVSLWFSLDVPPNSMQIACLKTCSHFSPEHTSCTFLWANKIYFDINIFNSLKM